VAACFDVKSVLTSAAAYLSLLQDSCFCNEIDSQAGSLVGSCLIFFLPSQFLMPYSYTTTFDY